MANETLILGNNNWAVKANNLLGYAVGETSGDYVPREFTFSRGSTATYTGENGLIQTASANIARIQDNALLLEPQRTNLITHSTDFSVIQWSRINLTMNYNSISSIFDGYSGSTVVLGVDASSVRHRLYQTVSVTSGVSYTYSIYAKKADSRWVQLLFQTTGFDIGAWANFDLDTGTVGNTGGSVVTARIQSVGDGWYRCSITSTATITASTLAETITTNNTNSVRYLSYQNLTAENYCYVIQAQLEAGAYPTTPILTSGATATRIADSALKTGISSLIGQSEGTVFLDFIFKASDSNVGGQIGISDSAKTNRLILWNNSSFNSLAIQLKASGTNAINNVSLGTFVDGTRYKIAIAYKSGDTAVYVNGTQSITNSASFTFSSSLTDFILGGYETTMASGHQFCFKTALFTSRLLNSELATLTT